MEKRERQEERKEMEKGGRIDCISLWKESLKDALKGQRGVVTVRWVNTNRGDGSPPHPPPGVVPQCHCTAGKEHEVTAPWQRKTPVAASLIVL